MIAAAFTNFLLTATFSSSFFGNPTKPIDLVNTKWIDPANDSCTVSLCFNSDQTVMYQPCDDDTFTMEVGYKITDGKIEIEAYAKGGLPKPN